MLFSPAHLNTKFSWLFRLFEFVIFVASSILVVVLLEPLPGLLLLVGSSGGGFC